MVENRLAVLFLFWKQPLQRGEQKHNGVQIRIYSGFHLKKINMNSYEKIGLQLGVSIGIWNLVATSHFNSKYSIN